MKPLERLDVIPLLEELHPELIALLRGLTPDDWNKPTVCRGWSVKDVVAHLLDTDMRRLSSGRDKLPPQARPPTSSYEDLVAFLNDLNWDWVRATRRMSPRLLVELQTIVGPQVNEYWKSIDLNEPARFAVAWAGEAISAKWFDCAREYTERWHHQQQIRDAVGAKGLTSRKWLHPVLATFVRALPVTYRDVAAAVGTTLVFAIEGEAGGEWTLRKEPEDWKLFMGAGEAPAAIVRSDADTAWRIFTNGMDASQAAKRTAIEGDEELGRPFVNSVAVIALKREPEPDSHIDTQALIKGY